MNAKSQIIELIAFIAVGFGLDSELTAATPTLIELPQSGAVLVGSIRNHTAQGSGDTAASHQWLPDSSALATATAPSSTIIKFKKANKGDCRVGLQPPVSVGSARFAHQTRN